LGLTAGLRGLGVWIARRVNKADGTRGRVLADRYHARPLTYPRQVRNTIIYVLTNASHCTSSERFRGSVLSPRGRSLLWRVVREFGDGRRRGKNPIRDPAPVIRTLH